MQEMIALYHLHLVWQQKQKEEPKKSPGHTTGRVKQQKHHAETSDPPSQDPEITWRKPMRHNNSPIITSSKQRQRRVATRVVKRKVKRTVKHELQLSPRITVTTTPWPDTCQATYVLCGQQASLQLPTNQIRPLLEALHKRLQIDPSNCELAINEILASHADPKIRIGKSHYGKHRLATQSH